MRFRESRRREVKEIKKGFEYINAQNIPTEKVGTFKLSDLHPIVNDLDTPVIINDLDGSNNLGGLTPREFLDEICRGNIKPVVNDLERPVNDLDGPPISDLEEILKEIRKGNIK